MTRKISVLNRHGKARAMKEWKMKQKERVNRVYERLEKALCEEDCSYEEAKIAVDKLREIYFNRKAGNFINKRSIQEIARQSSDMPY